MEQGKVCIQPMKKMKISLVNDGPITIIIEKEKSNG